MPTLIYSAGTPWLGILPNITTTATSLTLKSTGQSLNSKNTYIPSGTSPTTTAAQLAEGLLANAGQWNLDFPVSTQAPTGLLRPFGSTPQTRSFSGSVRRQMLPRLEVFADFAYNENKSASTYNAANLTLTVPAAAPTNPFSTAVRVRVPDAAQIPFTTTSESRNVTVGAVAQLPWGWTGALDYTWSENRFHSLYYNVDYVPVNADLLSGVLNPFVDTLLYPWDLKKYIYSQYYAGVSRLHDVALRGSGPLFVLPWGTPMLTVGLEHRLGLTPERTSQTAYPISVASSVLTTYYARESKTDSGYAEATLPLTKVDWLPAVHALELQLSGRSERYQVDTGTPYVTTQYNQTPAVATYGSPTQNGRPYFSKASYGSSNYTLGLKYQPVKEVTLRISRATAFLPPTPDQLLTDPEASVQNLDLDPVTKLTGQQIDVRSGGNPNLKPQSSKSLNAGIIWEPTWRPLQGLRLNAEYYKIEQFNAITTLDAQGIVNQENVYPERVTRNASGAITSVDASMVNLFHRETEGWDLSADYTLTTGIGSFNLRAVQSIILHLKNQYSQTQPEYDAVNFPTEFGSAKYKTTATLNWKWRRWTIGWTTRSVSSYKQFGAAGGPNATQRAVNGLAPLTTYTLRQGSDTIPSQSYHDAFVSVVFDTKQTTGLGSQLSTPGPKMLSGLTLQLGVRNVFDQVAPLDAYYSENSYLSPYGDLRLRSYWVSLRKQF